VDGRARRAVALLITFAFLSAPAMGAPIPSRATAETPEADLATIESFLARDEVAQALADNGLSRDEVERRLARLSAEDLSALAANVDQIQSAGEVPNYIWILLAALIVVTILATVF
jgi:hypothetical protein